MPVKSAPIHDVTIDSDTLSVIEMTASGLGYQAERMGNCVQVTAQSSESTLILQTTNLDALMEFRRCMMHLEDQMI